MLKYVFYPVFGLGVLGAYGVSAMGATDMTSVSTYRSAVPAQYRTAGGYQTAPVIWRTGFHGPAAYQPASSSSNRSGSGGVGFYGGFGGGK